MKIKLAKYVAKLLAKNGITQCFSVTGGGAMHLNDGFGHEPGINTLYMHHEQACAMAAESYARIYNKPAICCITTGPGGTNAITGVVGAWTDSIPMIVISGQVRYDNTARWSGVGIRVMGDQEFDITRSIDCMTKYCKMVLDPMSIRAEIEKCIYLSQTGRPGPVWLDIPVDVQGMLVEETELEPFDFDYYSDEKEKMLDAIDELEEAAHSIPRYGYRGEELADPLLNVSFMKQKWQTDHEKIDKNSPVIREIVERIRSAKRPVFYTGNGIRIAGCEDLFLKVADKLAIPVVVGWNGQDIIPSEHPLKAGQPGGRGDRPGNFAVQNADLILSIGSRLSIRQVGYNYASWAREAFTIVCDIDEEELKKPTVHVDLPVHADAADLLHAIDGMLTDMHIVGHESDYNDLDALCDAGYPEGGSFLFQGGEGKNGRSWREQCAYWMKKYPVYQQKFADHGDDEYANMYEFYDMLSRSLAPDTVTVVGNGSADVAGGQIWYINQGSRFISQDGIASMGYDLPAAIGACIGCHDAGGRVKPVTYSYEEYDGDRHIDDKAQALGELDTARKNPWWKGRHEIYPAYYDHDVICVTGDGSIMMNLQELQTIVSHRMPIKIFLVNNGGYHSIRQTQQNLFQGEPLVGIGDDSYDLSFPEFERVAAAFGIPYARAEHNSDLRGAIDYTLSLDGPVICEVFVSRDQPFEPKSSVKKHEDGSLSGPPLEDLSPFLSDEELEEEMIVPPFIGQELLRRRK